MDLYFPPVYVKVCVNRYACVVWGHGNLNHHREDVFDGLSLPMKVLNYGGLNLINRKGLMSCQNEIRPLQSN